MARRNRSMKKGKLSKKLSRYTMKMASKTARVGKNFIKKGASVIQTETERLGSSVSAIAQKSAPVVQKGLEGIFDTLKTGAKYTLNKATDATRSIAKSVRRRRRSRKSRK
jgi:type IV secretory pathway TrbL component